METNTYLEKLSQSGLSKRMFLLVYFFSSLFFCAFFSELSAEKIISCSFELPSSEIQEAVVEEILFIPLIMRNHENESQQYSVSIIAPDQWRLLSNPILEKELSPLESYIQIIGIKIPAATLAGRYQIKIVDSYNSVKELHIDILPKRGCRVFIEDLLKCYDLDDPIDITIRCVNQGNIPMVVRLEATSDPLCQLNYSQEPYAIAPFSSGIFPIHVEPNLCQDEKKQFVLFKILDCLTEETLQKETISIDFRPFVANSEDPYIRIPTEVSFISFTDQDEFVQAVEYSGQGIIDPTRNRSVDFYICLPTQNNYRKYGIEESFYLELAEPSWDLFGGDTSYELSPLTQQYQYGRGGGFDVYGKHLSAGSHYCKNIFEKKGVTETASFIQADVNENFYIKTNYLNKELRCTPTSNILSVESGCYFPKNGGIECEIGKNFINHLHHMGKNAYRFDIYHTFTENISMEIEKIKVDSGFFGYYRDTDVFSGHIEFPLFNQMQGSFSATSLSQNYRDLCCHRKLVLAPRQLECYTNVAYPISPHTILNLNSQTLRAQDVGWTNQYNFFQQWFGGCLSTSALGYSLYGSCGFGYQREYCRHKSSSFLQKYYLYIGRELHPRLYSSAFYEGGNTNYYDATHWRTTVGGSLQYRYSNRGYIEVLGQWVNNKPDSFVCIQGMCNLRHTFKNLHYLFGTIQYYHYQSHYPNNLLLYISYSIPIQQAVGRKSNVCSVEGVVYDTWKQLPVSHAVVNVNGLRAKTDRDGHYTLQGIPAGEKKVKAELLPDHYICTENLPIVIEAKERQHNRVDIFVSPDCHIEGHIALYQMNECMKNSLLEQELILDKDLSLIRVMITRDNGAEIYYCTSDNKGNFFFPNLRPGKWELDIDTEELPALTYLEKNHFIIDLKPQDQIKVSCKVLPITRGMIPIYIH